MKNVRCLFAALAAVCLSLGASAQEKQYQHYPYAFVGLQGGAQVVCTDHMQFDRMIRPMGAVSVGAYFTPVVGARINAQGWSATGWLNSIESNYDYKYSIANVDLLLNLTNLFGKREYGRFNAVLIGGVGLAYAWDNKEIKGLSGYTETNVNKIWNDDLLSHNFRAALQLGYDFGRNVGVNLELGANSMSDRFNSKSTNTDDWQPYALVGLQVNFGHKKVKVAEPEPVVEPEPVWETRVDTIWYDETAYKEVEIEESITRNIHYPLRGSDPKPEEQLQAIADFVKAHTGCHVDIKAYADKGTGNPRLNKHYSELRRKGTVESLIERGVPESIIKSESFGDTVQPFPNNDDNRVSITTATGKTTKKEPYTVRKFRLEEHRVRVQ